MNGISILERIIQEEGSCTWGNRKVCAACPLGKLARDKNGGYMSCVESLHIDGLPEDQQDARYKKAAQEKLADLTLESLIEEE